MNWTLIGIGGCLFTLIGVSVYFYNTGKDICEQKQTIVTLTKVVTVKEKQNEIRNNPISISDVTRRLHAGNF